MSPPPDPPLPLPLTEPDGATPLDPDEAEGLRLDSIRTRGDLDRVEQANIVDGLAWLSRRRQTDVLDEPFLRRLHRELFGQVWRWAGTYRQTEKNIGVEPRQIQVELRKLLDDVRAWIEYRSYPPREMALRFHHRLVRIHLFANGNGRHARIAADVLLQQLGEARIDWLPGDQPLQQAGALRTAYIEALRSADGGDYRALLELYGAT